MLLLSSWVENPKNRDHLRSRSVINEIETRSGVIESTFFFTPTSPNCYFSLHNQHSDLNKRPVKAELLQEGIFFLIHLFARDILVMKKLEIGKTKPTFIISVLKVKH